MGNTASKHNKVRDWIYPKLIKGKLYNYRNWLSYALLTLMFTGPFIKINGEQLVLFNILERKFVFFGVVFWPQDFHIFVLAMITFIVFIILFTVVFGRVWCGWACPQTIFMEMLFRKIEFWIEGDAVKQRKLDSSPLTVEKFVKKASKHSLFSLISFLIANIFLAYIIGLDELVKIISEPVKLHIYGFIAIILFTITFYLVFARLREIVCTVICPYGRLQGVLLDKQSLVVAYDYERGEPRGKLNRDAPVNNAPGDCIDCNVCVQVCPTGIDIREGTQLECINCTLCIDACDMVMEKINRPTRLIGFKSQEQITSRQAFRFSKRLYGYAAILAVLVSVLAILLVKRSDIETVVLRASGTLYQQRTDGTVSNLYNAELINKTAHPIKFRLMPIDKDTKIQFIRKEDTIGKGKSIKLTFFIIRPQKEILKYKSDIELKVLSEGKLVEELSTTFIAPPNL
ncbi:cytochrome c oxidase accessory protein CcoG [Pedobacter sp. P351]|uniref:cytochrome c oxidase accessory protein CcoG n=1 Tax=Pedobacter superstes TaxID=3133441 RepID=UPI0030B3E8A7